MGDSHRVVPPRSGVGHPLVHQRALDRFRVTRGGPPDPQLPSILHGGRTSSSAPAAGVPPPRVHRAIGGHSDAVTARGHGYRLGRSQPALHEPGKAHHALPSHARPPYACRSNLFSRCGRQDSRMREEKGGVAYPRCRRAPAAGGGAPWSSQVAGGESASSHPSHPDLSLGSSPPIPCTRSRAALSARRSRARKSCRRDSSPARPR
mmetsp:Transcript_57942/g.183905  ORF Transcript_57942/g.183905 Transcript_57942/m.183905 type:complete len:206 (+) Transcript_57942:2604-3221(+)